MTLTLALDAVGAASRPADAGPPVEPRPRPASGPEPTARAADATPVVVRGGGLPPVRPAGSSARWPFRPATYGVTRAAGAGPAVSSFRPAEYARLERREAVSP